MLWTKTIKNLLIFYTLLYSLGSFIALSFNIFTWDVFQRGLTGSVYRMVLGMGVVAVSMIIIAETGRKDRG